MGFVDARVIASNSVMTATDVPMYVFGILQSILHVMWVRTLCGRMKSDFRYSPAMYNNFPWIDLSEEQKSSISNTAQGIIDARNKYPNSSLEQLYSPDNGLPPLLHVAHIANDKAVLKAYGFSYDMEEAEIVAGLMKMYQKLTEEK